VCSSSSTTVDDSLFWVQPDSRQRDFAVIATCRRDVGGSHSLLHRRKRSFFVMNITGKYKIDREKERGLGERDREALERICDTTSTKNRDLSGQPYLCFPLAYVSLLEKFVS